MRSDEEKVRRSVTSDSVLFASLFAALDGARVNWMKGMKKITDY